MHQLILVIKLPYMIWSNLFVICLRFTAKERLSTFPDAFKFPENSLNTFYLNAVRNTNNEFVFQNGIKVKNTAVFTKFQFANDSGNFQLLPITFENSVL